MNYKSAGILTELHNGHAAGGPLHGKYWMYWGEVHIHLATSADLIHWTPVLDPKTGLPQVVMSARAGHFDSGVSRGWTAPSADEKGIVLIYNGKKLRGSEASNEQKFTGRGCCRRKKRRSYRPISFSRRSQPFTSRRLFGIGEALFSSSQIQGSSSIARKTRF
jgi:hypothetical protein